MRGGKARWGIGKGGLQRTQVCPSPPLANVLPTRSQDSGQRLAGEGQGLVVPRASRRRAQGTAVHDPELHLRGPLWASGSLSRKMQELEIVGWAGNSLLFEGRPGLSNKGFKEYPLCPTRS